jgi:hypothetical protein
MPVVARALVQRRRKREQTRGRPGRSAPRRWPASHPGVLRFPDR